MHSNKETKAITACCWTKTCMGKINQEFICQKNDSNEWSIDCDAIMRHIQQCDCKLHKQLLYVKLCVNEMLA